MVNKSRSTFATPQKSPRRLCPRRLRGGTYPYGEIQEVKCFGIEKAVHKTHRSMDSAVGFLDRPGNEFVRREPRFTITVVQAIPSLVVSTDPKPKQTKREVDKMQGYSKRSWSKLWGR